MLGVLRSPWVRIGFVVVALAGAVYAIASDWGPIVAALHRLPVGNALLAVAVNVVYLGCTWASWARSCPVALACSRSTSSVTHSC